jgi:hypothetical protein
MNKEHRSVLMKRTGNTIRRKTDRIKFLPPIDTNIEFNPNKAKNWELTTYNDKPIIYYYDEHRRRQHERYGLGFNKATKQYVKMGQYRRAPVTQEACLMGVTNRHFIQCDKTYHWELLMGNKIRKDRRNDKRSNRMKTIKHLNRTLNELNLC